MQSLQAGLALAILAAAPALAQDDLVKTARASMTSADGAPLGLLALSTTPAGVIIRGELRGLPPGYHGFHVHAAGACEPPGSAVSSTSKTLAPERPAARAAASPAGPAPTTRTSVWAKRLA